MWFIFGTKWTLAGVLFYVVVVVDYDVSHATICVGLTYETYIYIQTQRKWNLYLLKAAGEGINASDMMIG